METLNHSFPWLELIEHPAFCVKDGIIIAANSPAERRLLQVGTDVREIVTENREAYESFRNGSLYLTIHVCGLPCPASVTRTQDWDIFHIHPDSEDGSLQALALAAMQLRVPLANVMTVTDRLFSDLKTADPEIQKQAGQINQNLYRLLRIISNMSDAGNYYCDDMQTSNLTSVIDEVVNKAQVCFSGSNIHLEYSSLQAPVLSLANTEKLERAIYNLLSNAARFSPSGSTVTATLTKNENQLVFCVRNETAEDLAEGNLWQRYRREPGIEDPRHGLGLGMALISAAASVHGGTVLVDHPSAKETRVTMTIPIVKENSSNVRTPVLRISDYAGGRDKGLLELAEILPSNAYNNIN